MPIPWYLTALRLIVPLSILLWPLWGTFASELIDLRDWYYINFKNPQDYVTYQYWDKAMDLYYLSLALIVVWRWKDKIARNLATFLFIDRIIGEVLFWATGKEFLLFFFPNVFESFVVFYLIYPYIFKKTFVWNIKTYAILTLVLVIPKLIIEYLLHVIKTQAWQFYNLGNDNLNFAAQGLIFFIIPFALGIYFLRPKPGVTYFPNRKPKKNSKK